MNIYVAIGIMAIIAVASIAVVSLMAVILVRRMKTSGNNCNKSFTAQYIHEYHFVTKCLLQSEIYIDVLDLKVAKLSNLYSRWTSGTTKV